MDVKVLGPGCAKCKKLYEATEKAIGHTGVAATLTKVEKLDEIMAFDIMSTPALVIDGVVKSSGRIPSAAELEGWLRASHAA
jgi:small redox-active disulfide protein 2